MTSSSSPKKASSGVVVIVTVGIVVLFSILFIIEFLRISRPPEESAAVTLSADTYATEVSGLLAVGDATRGQTLIETYQCQACHVQGAGQIAPGFTGLSQVAATRRPPLTAEAYIYEAIVHPGAFLVPKDETTTYPNSMPANYAQQLSEQDLGDVIAYLLTQ